MSASPLLEGIEGMRHCMLDKCDEAEALSLLLASPALGNEAFPHAQDFVITPLPTSRGNSAIPSKTSKSALGSRARPCACQLAASVGFDEVMPMALTTLLVAAEKAWPQLEAWSLCPWCGRKHEGQLRAFMAQQLHQRLACSEDNELRLWSAVNAGQALLNSGCYPAAEELLRPTMVACDKILGSEHPLTLGALHTLGRVLTALRSFDEAVQLLRRNFAAQRRFRGDMHCDVRISARALACALMSSEGFDAVCEGIDLMRWEIRNLQRLGLEKPEIKRAACDLEFFLQSCGLRQEARTLRRLALQPVEPSDHVELTLEQRLARKALMVMRRILGAESHDFLSIANNWAAELYERGGYAEAARIQEEILETLQKDYGMDSPETLTAANNLACCYNFLGQSADALDLHRDILARRMRTLGAIHPDTRKSTQNLEAALEIVNRLNEAVNAYVDEGLAAAKTRGKDGFVESLDRASGGSFQLERLELI